MTSASDRLLQRWQEAGLIDAGTADRIRSWESAQDAPGTPHKFAAIAFGLGGLLLIAGVFLFVSAHWAELSPAARYTVVLAAVAVFHVGGALSATTMPHLATTLHAAGTAALGAGIFLCGQIFNMAEHWPLALLLWALGAAVSAYLLRDWPHVLWVAILIPAWLWGEWIDALPGSIAWRDDNIPVIGTTLLVLTYLGALGRDQDSVWRQALSRLGIATVIPACIALGLINSEVHNTPIASVGGNTNAIVAWSMALLLPFLLAFALRGKQAAYLVVALAWALLVARTDWHSNSGAVALYGLYGIGAVGIVAWGIKERSRGSVNVGVTGFALALFGFYFSAIFDKLGRSLGMIGIGLLFLGGGWVMERMRRRLIASVEGRKP
ncbi:MAG: DUF2157 domain-containing protein [Steroidobacteraceae bacterium]|jgi:uncharacterized membrane protein